MFPHRCILRSPLQPWWAVGRHWSTAQLLLQESSAVAAGMRTCTSTSAGPSWERLPGIWLWRAAQHTPALWHRCEVKRFIPKSGRKAISPIPGQAALEAPRPPCGKPSCRWQDARPGNTDRLLKWLRLLAVFPYSQKWQSTIFYWLSHTVSVVSVQKQEVEKDIIHNWGSRKRQYRRQAFEPCSLKSAAPSISFHGPLLSRQGDHKQVTGEMQSCLLKIQSYTSLLCPPRKN